MQKKDKWFQQAVFAHLSSALGSILILDLRFLQFVRYIRIGSLFLFKLRSRRCSTVHALVVYSSLPRSVSGAVG